MQLSRVSFRGGGDSFSHSLSHHLLAYRESLLCALPTAVAGSLTQSAEDRGEGDSGDSEGRERVVTVRGGREW